MARPKTNRAPDKIDAIASADIDTEKLDHARQALVQRSEGLATIDMRFALDGDYSYARIDSMMPAAMTMNATSALWLGRACILVKEHEPAGTFGAFLKTHGVHPRTARRYMTVARCFGSSDQRKLLVGRLGISKALELLGESDEDIDALAAADEDDPIYAMSRAEIRAFLAKKAKAIAKLEDKLTASDDLLAAKNKKIDELDRALSVTSKSPLSDQADERLCAINALKVEAGSALVRFRAQIDELEGLYTQAGEAVPLLVTESVDEARGWLTGWINTICTDLGE